MPELPEVENVRQGLLQQVKGKTIANASVYWANIIKEPDVDQFVQQLENQTIEDIGRRGKFLLFYLTDWTLISHLRMEGKYVLVPKEEPLKKHTHVIFHMEDDLDLRYMDVRKFGRMNLIEKGEEATHPSLQKLGPEPVPEAFEKEQMKQHLQRYKKAIKAVLLDQTLVAGIGNIYADEVLFEAGILPDRPAFSLTDSEMNHLHQAILDVLQRAVTAGGTTIRSYKNSFGESGHFQNYLNVYGKENEACTRCQGTIQKTKVAQRGTHYCPNCQQ